jgi:hypothetical protein
MPKHVLIEFKKWMCYIDGQKNKYSALNECSRMLKYNVDDRCSLESDSLRKLYITVISIMFQAFQEPVFFILLLYYLSWSKQRSFQRILS